MLRTKQQVVAKAIVQILGRPASYIEEIMQKIVEKIKQEKGIELLSSNIAKPEKIKEKDNKQQKEVYSCFADVELKFDDISKLLDFMVAYMPASIEIVEPANFMLDLNQINNFIANVLTKLHNYDAALKQLQLQLKIIANYLKNKKQNKNTKQD